MHSCGLVFIDFFIKKKSELEPIYPLLREIDVCLIQTIFDVAIMHLLLIIMLKYLNLIPLEKNKSYLNVTSDNDSINSFLE